MDCLVAVLAVRTVQADPVAYPPFLAWSSVTVMKSLERLTTERTKDTKTGKDFY